LIILREIESDIRNGETMGRKKKHKAHIYHRSWRARDFGSIRIIVFLLILAWLCG